MATIDVKDASGSTVAIEKPLAPGRAAAASSRPVALSSEDFAVIDGLETLITSTNAKLDLIRQPGLNASATFTPAASSHVANDCNGAAGTFALAAVSGSSILIKSVSLEIDGATAEVSAWRLYLYNITPPSAIADDGAWDLGSGDRATFLGYIDLGTAVDLGSTQWVQAESVEKMLRLAGTSVFGYLVNLTTLTPANVAHIVGLNAVQL